MARLIMVILTAVFLSPIYVCADIPQQEGAETIVTEDSVGEPLQGEKSPRQDIGKGKPQSQPPREYLTNLTATDDSPRNTFKVEYWEGNENHENEIWLVPRGKPESRFFLSEYGYSGGALFSPNEKWIALTDVVDVCCRQDVLLFRCGKDGRYTRVKNAEIPSRALVPIRWMLPTLKGVKLDRLYAEAVAWSDNERALLVRIYGELTDGGHILHPCYCVFDVERLKASLDLALFNKSNHEMSPLIKKKKTIEQ